jgi:N6-adenosine-specific RNA methylase IME4
MARFSIIYADPPWKYNNRANHKTRFRGGACGHYQLMSMPEIAALPIGDIAAENSALFMWCTFPYLDEQIRLFEHWGFKYRTSAFTWIKTNPGTREPFFGVGYYTKSNAEVCLLGVRGRMKPISNEVSSVVISPRREHSRKPDEVRQRIVQLFGDLSRVELFARQNAPGWAGAGNGVDGTDIRATLRELAATPDITVTHTAPMQSAMELL